MIATLKKLFAKDPSGDLPKFLNGAKNEREALILLKETRKRDEERRDKSNARLKEIADAEQRMMDEGKQDGIASSRKQHLVRLIKQGREEQRDILVKLEKIYNPRLKATCTHISSLETIIEVQGEVTPTSDSVEEMAIKAKNLMEDLDTTYELVNGINKTSEPAQRDPEDMAIVDEMNTLAEEDRLKKHEEESKKAEAMKKKEAAKKGKEKKPEKKLAPKKKVREVVPDDFEGDEE